MSFAKTKSLYAEKKENSINPRIEPYFGEFTK
jgi:hypothetical protein